MDCDVASRALARGLEAEPAVGHIRRERIDMALETQEPALAPDQEHPVHASVRRVARDTAFHAGSAVLEDERAPLVDMASDAGFPIGAPEHRLIPAPVRVVAVRAGDQSFLDRVVCRQGELSGDRCVASEAEARLARPEKSLAQPAVLLRPVRTRQVRGMAVLAGHSVQLMLGMVESLGLAVGLMASEALSGILGGRPIEE
jgi:hypothetical protein